MLGLKSISFHEPQKTHVQKPGMGFHSTHPCHNSPRQISASEASRFAESLSPVLTQLAADEESLCVSVGRLLILIVSMLNKYTRIIIITIKTTRTSSHSKRMKGQKLMAGDLRPRIKHQVCSVPMFDFLAACSSLKSWGGGRKKREVRILGGMVWVYIHPTYPPGIFRGWKWEGAPSFLCAFPLFLLYV